MSDEMERRVSRLHRFFWFWSFLVAPALVSILLVGVGWAAPQSLDLARANSALRSFSATDIDGREWSGVDLEGKVVLIDFWATWCAPCLAEIPFMHEVSAKYPDDFLAIGVSLDRASRRDVVKWINRQRVSWPQVHDGRGFGGEVALAFGIEMLPTSVLIDHRGRVRAFTPRGERFVAAVDRLVAEMRAER